MQDVVKEVRLIADALNFVQSVAVVIRESSKRKSLFMSLFGSDEVACNLLGLCPTRWCVRASALARVVKCYPTLLQCLTDMTEDRAMRGDARAKIFGLVKQARTMRLYFAITCSDAIFQPAEAVARQLQNKKISASSALESITILRERIKNLRKDESVSKLMEAANVFASANNLKTPKDPRMSKTPARFRNTEESGALSSVGEGAWKRQYIEALDLVQAELDRRFDQADLLTAADREKAVLSCANGEERSYTKISLPDAIRKDRLKTELTLLSDVVSGKTANSVQKVAEILSQLNPQTLDLFKETRKFVELCICLPVSAASAERSFSALRRLKTWLRSSMTQKRLTHIALMHVHQNILDTVDVKELMKQFIEKTPERKATFGSV